MPDDPMPEPDPNVDHGFVGPTPDVTRVALRQALVATFDFFDRVMQGTPAPAPARP